MMPISDEVSRLEVIRAVAKLTLCLVEANLSDLLADEKGPSGCELML